MNHDGILNPVIWEEISGPLLTREEVLNRLRSDPEMYQEFLNLSEEFQEDLLAFSMGVKGAKISYDPFFKFVFDPVIHPERLEDFLSTFFGERAEIIEVLPNESKRITEEGSLLVADLLVRLQSGALVNVEIQRIGYYFPGARCACYSSDLVMRQYSQIRARRRREKKRFSYGELKKVYTIVLMHQSTKEFHDLPDDYLHYAKQTFQTGLQMDLLQEYILVPLDIFLNISHTVINRMEAWLYFIASDRIEDIKKVCTAYPDFKEIYQEVFEFRYHTGELISMFSEALRLLDYDTVQYMIEDMQNQIEQQKQRLADKDQELADKEHELADKNQELAGLHLAIEQLKAQIKELEKHNP